MRTGVVSVQVCLWSGNFDTRAVIDVNIYSEESCTHRSRYAELLARKRFDDRRQRDFSGPVLSAAKDAMIHIYVHT